MTTINSTEKKVLDTINKYNMFSQNDRVLIGLSGGKDSVALIYLLNKFSKDLKISVVAFHLNHGIRGEESFRDEYFSQKLSEKLGVDFLSSRVDVIQESKACGESIEVVARRLRYESFSNAAKKANCNKIATAHTASDNSETYFISLLRNSNPKCIPPVRDNIVRPIIELTSNEVKEYLEENSLECIFDSTNTDNEYLRNFVRNKIMPLIYSINPSFDDNISKTYKIQRSYEDLCRMEVEKYYKNNEFPLFVKSLRTLLESDAYNNVLFGILQKEATKIDVNISYSQFLDIKDLICSGNVGQKIALSKGYYVFRDYEDIKIIRDDHDFEPFDLLIKHGANFIPNSNIILYLETLEEYEKRINKNSKKINKLTKNILIKYNIIDKPLYARSRRIGDSYISNAITRNIKKHMINEKIPLALRSRIPVVYDDSGIIWTPGLGVADRLLENSGDVYSLSIYINE